MCVGTKSKRQIHPHCFCVGSSKQLIEQIEKSEIIINQFFQRSKSSVLIWWNVDIGF